MENHSILTRREREIAALVATGASNKEIAYQLTISDKTVKNILTKVFVKTGTRSRTELAVQLVQARYNAQ
ncbi:MAG: response regulator transcription factor [Chloroflexi bacterium]|nr:response regulator transcription factor [Chloroflexota bacterium]